MYVQHYALYCLSFLLNHAEKNFDTHDTKHVLISNMMHLFNKKAVIMQSLGTINMNAYYLCSLNEIYEMGT